MEKAQLSTGQTLLTTGQVSKFLNISASKISKLVKAGEITAYRIGSDFRFTIADLTAYLNERQVGRRKPIELIEAASQDTLKEDQNRGKTPIDQLRHDARIALKEKRKSTDGRHSP